MLKTFNYFKNLSQEDYNGKYIDFHNDFDCIKVILIDKVLFIIFKSIIDEQIIKFKFLNVTIRLFEFANTFNVKNLTIDNLYRGKIEENGNLIEFKSGSKGYFYLEFDEGQKLEFWSSELILVTEV